MDKKISDTKLTTYEVVYGGASLGLVDGVEFKVTPELQDIKCDEFHEQVLDKRAVGYEVKLKGNLRQITLESYKIAGIPWHETNLNLTPTKLGQSMYSSAKALVLHPHHLPATDKTLDIEIDHALIISGLELKNSEKDAAIPFEILALPDHNKLAQGEFYIGKIHGVAASTN